MSERLEQRMDISVGVIVRHAGVNEPCLSRTLSTRGILLGTQKRWPIGTQVDLEIVHQDRRIPARARVASHSSGGVGFEFVSSDAEFLKAIDAIVKRFLPTDGMPADARTVPPSHVTAAWSPVPDGVLLHFWRNRRRSGRLIDLSLDGAAIACTNRPEVGEEVMFYLSAGKVVEGAAAKLQSRARVVRHTEHGFAVQFIAASLEFRRAVSEIRKASRQGR